MNVSAEVLAAATAIAVSLIAGIASFIVAVLGKEQKTSEFRQAWIDTLRNDIADYVSQNLAFVAALKIQGNRQGADKDLGEYILTDKFQEIICIEALRARILLHLNPKEHTKLIELVNNIYGKSGIAKPDTYETLPERVEALIRESRIVFKAEWKRVKIGEPTISDHEMGILGIGHRRGRGCGVVLFLPMICYQCALIHHSSGLPSAVAEFKH